MIFISTTYLISELNMASFEEAAAPAALVANFKILSNLHPVTPWGWDEVKYYIDLLKLVDQMLGITQQAMTAQYGLAFVGARAALAIAKNIIVNEILDAQACITHRDNGGCPDKVCTTECFAGLNDKRFQFSQVLLLCLNLFDMES